MGSDPDSRDLTPEERAAILAEWQRLAAEPRPVSPRPYGCATFLIAGIILLIVPPMLERLGVKLPALLSGVLLVLLVLILAGGFVVGLFFGSGVYGRAHERARVALDWLADHPDGGDTDERRKSAVALLYYALVSEGPTLSSTFDAAQARTRLGAGLPYVVAVERALRAEGKVDPIFTERDDPQATPRP